MTVHTHNRLSVVLDGLSRWRWWISAALCAVLVFVVGDGGGGLLTWVLFGLFAVLLWVPALVRWGNAIRGAGKAFREGLDGQ